MIGKSTIFPAWPWMLIYDNGEPVRDPKTGQTKLFKNTEQMQKYAAKLEGKILYEAHDIINRKQ